MLHTVIQFQAQDDRQMFEHAADFARQQLRTLIERYPDFYPMYTMEGRWRHSGEAWTHWCDGFLPGMLWILYGMSPDAPDGAWWREQAIRYSRPLEPRKLDRNVHDLGFIFMSTYYRWFEFTQDPALRDVVVEAGRTMSLRFKENGEYLRSFVSEDSLFIDIMMNVGVIFYAACATADPRLLEVAMRHTLTSRRVLVRGDGSTAHEGIFDLNTGEFLRQTTHQGYRGDSCWSRGLAWSLYGFGACFELTGDRRFLNAAEQNAEFYLMKTGSHGEVPPWDYDAPTDGKLSITQPDSSAAAIAAVGLFNLAKLTADRVRAQGYESAAMATVRTLTRPPYLADGDSNWEGILKRGVYHIHKGLGVDESVMWGEFFFVEALTKALALL